MIRQAAELAEKLAREAGKLARDELLREKEIRFKDEYGDVVTEVDLAAERLIVDGILKMFPEHRVVGEEFGSAGLPDSEWVWAVDPLDGTNNYAVGLPLHGVCISLLKGGEPELGVVYDPHMDRMYTALRGQGVVCNGVPLKMKEGGGKWPTVAWVQGYKVRDDSRGMRLKHHLDKCCKRVFRLWAPSLAWCMLARGDLDAVVVYRSGGLDLFAGLLVAMEAGSEVRWVDADRSPGLNGPVSLVAAKPGRMDEIWSLVREGLDGNLIVDSAGAERSGPAPGAGG
ncbi:inositol monophosphatase family protein [Staphylospora marina]|uniref:inositol monophosphatase family protein n=1 Tax=Staphylospora marina TaxID=2490858 RepID=UPI0013DE0A89|nr:inositol monophosphatase [Staphylospora marina]